MEKNLNIVCPGCGWSVAPPPEPGAYFCGHCGKEMPPRDPVHSSEPMVEDEIPDRPVPSPAPKRIATPPAPDPTEPPPDRDFILKYNVARVFLQGYHSTFNFRIEAPGGKLPRIKDFDFELRLAAHRTPLKKTLHGIPWGGEFHLDFKPEESGYDIAADVTIAYKLEDVQKRLEGQFLWDCYPPDAQPSKIIENLSIKMEGVTPDRAAEQNISILDGLKSSPGKSHAEQIRELKRLKPVWEPVNLYSCEDSGGTGQEMPPVQPGAALDRLTLLAGDEMVHLLAMNPILGKNKKSHITTRLFDPDGSIFEDATNCISRFHCRIEIEGQHARLYDRAGKPGSGTEKKSSNGTFLDGNRIEEGKQATLPLDRPFQISLADKPALDGSVFCVQGRCWTSAAMAQNCSCPGPRHHPDDVACMVLHREDLVRETYIILKTFCEGAALPSFLRGLGCICRRNGAFMLTQKGSGKPQCRWLQPGMAIGGVKVVDFKQYEGEDAGEG